MDFINIPFKSIISTAAVGVSLLVVGLANDISLFSSDFMDNEKIEFVKRLDDDNSDRYTASSWKTAVKLPDLECNDTNALIVNGKWKIVKIIDTFSVGVKERDRIETQFSLVCDEEDGKGAILIGSEEESQLGYPKDIIQKEDGSLTMTIIKTADGGHEFLEAIKIKEEVVVAKVEEETSEEIISENNFKSRSRGGVIFPKESKTFYLSEVKGNSKFDILNIDKEDNKFVISELGEIEELSITIPGYPKIDKSTCEIKEGGVVKDGNDQSIAIISSLGESKYILRFFPTGALSGAELHFVTDEVFESVALAEEEKRDVEDAINNKSDFNLVKADQHSRNNNLDLDNDGVDDDENDENYENEEESRLARLDKDLNSRSERNQESYHKF